jgi:5-methylcytosine-specific restriction endonuclease McrA
MANHRLTHYIPPAAIPPELPKEFVEPNPSDHFIYWLFKYRCVVCKRPASEINEIVPRGRSKKSILDWKNRISMCGNCHTGDDGFHHNGVTDEKINAMRKARVEYLIAINREAYV